MPHAYTNGILTFYEDVGPGLPAPRLPAGRGRAQVAARLSEIAAPALVIVGDKDIADFQFMADLLAENLPNARPYGRPSGRKPVIPDCGHVPPLEAPEALNKAVIGFLRKVSRRRTLS